jgi:hypothetical protein
MSHPTCKLAAAGTAFGGAVYNGVAKLSPCQPGVSSSVLVLIAE